MHQPPQKLAKSSLGAGYLTRSKAFGLFVVLTALLFMPVPISAEASAVTRGYNVSESLPPGTLVSVSQSDPNSVEPTNINNAAYIAGTIATTGEGTIELGASSSQVYVAISGDAQMLVSDVAGDIVKGDLIGPSSISGVGQKVSKESGGKVIGVAQSDFDESTAEKQTIEGKEVSIGAIPMQVLLSEVAGSAQSPTSFLENVGVAVTGSYVSVVRVIIASLIFVTILIVSGMMMFGGIKGAFMSIGRNPLASESIYTSLMHATVVASTVMVLGLVVAYMVMVL